MAGKDDQTKSHLQTVGLNWNGRWSEDWSTRVGFTRGTERYETTPSTYLTETQVDSWLLRNELRVGPGRLTVDLERREDRLENASTTPQNTDRHQNALAVGYGLRAGDHTLQANLRRDDDSEFGVNNTGSLAYGYALSRSLQLTASAEHGLPRAQRCSSASASTAHPTSRPRPRATLRPACAGRKA